jgi:branched-chain amino acid transport system substrate-binding protein
MVRLRATATSAAAVLAVVVAAGCSATGSDKKESGSDSGPIKIALVDAQSGQLSSLGAWELKGAKLAVTEMEHQGWHQRPADPAGRLRRPGRPDHRHQPGSQDRQ